MPFQTPPTFEFESVATSTELQVLSDNQDWFGNRPAVKLRRDADTSWPDGVAQEVTWQTVLFDTHSFWDSQNPDFVTIPYDGLWFIRFHAFLNYSGTSGYTNLTVRPNSPTDPQYETSGAVNPFARTDLSFHQPISAGTKLYSVFLQSGTGASRLLGGGPGLGPFFEAIWVRTMP